MVHTVPFQTSVHPELSSMASYWGLASILNISSDTQISRKAQSRGTGIMASVWGP